MQVFSCSVFFAVHDTTTIQCKGVCMNGKKSRESVCVGETNDMRPVQICKCLVAVYSLLCMIQLHAVQRCLYEWEEE